MDGYNTVGAENLSEELRILDPGMTAVRVERMVCTLGELRRKLLKLEQLRL